MLLNRRRAEGFMHEYELDVLVATSPVNITYFTDYFCWVDLLLREYMVRPGGSSRPVMPGFAVLPATGEPALIVSAGFGVNATDLWVRDIRVFGDLGFEELLTPSEWEPRARRIFEIIGASGAALGSVDGLTRVLAERGLSDARIGLELEGLAGEVAQPLLSALPRASVKDCTNLIRLIRAVKSVEEIARLRRAAEISESAAAEALAQGRPGRRVLELGQEYRARVAALGADFDHFLFGVQGVGMASEPDYVLRKDDGLYVDYGCVYRRYFSDAGTTMVMPHAPPELIGTFEAVRMCVAEGAEALRPGVRASAVYAALCESLAESGIRSRLAHGHGLGLEVRDYPIVVADNGLRIRDDCLDLASDLVLEPNMVINLEAPIFAPGVGSVHVEQTFLVTEEGSELLCTQDRTQPIAVRSTS